MGRRLQAIASITVLVAAWITAGNAQPSLTQRVVLYEEDDDPVGKRFDGSVVWSLQATSSAPRDTAIRGDVTIPDRELSVTWFMQRSPDASLPASHTISLTFKLPKQFAHYGISEVRGILMKQSEQTRGVALSGASVKVLPGSFVVRLLPTQADSARNLKLLRERSWLDLAIVYADGKRAIMAISKGSSGERLFYEALAAWGDD
jgi:hypothetical protein